MSCSYESDSGLSADRLDGTKMQAVSMQDCICKRLVCISGVTQKGYALYVIISYPLHSLFPFVLEITSHSFSHFLDCRHFV
jgi:hypothetical protein